MPSDASQTRPAVVYLARGADADPLPRFRRFVQSYRRHAAGEDHALYVIFKGYESEAHLQAARDVFAALAYAPIHTGDDSFDLGAYRDAAAQIPVERLCFFNSNSEILTGNWLAKLSANLGLPYVGMVGATGSLESLRLLNADFPRFPNIHLRSNGFMVRRDLFLACIEGRPLATKLDAFFIESGPDSITRRIVDRGQSVLIVGRDGRGYGPDRWVDSNTFRLRDQSNLLIDDNVTRAFAEMPFPKKQEFARKSWGPFLDGQPRE